MPPDPPTTLRSTAVRWRRTKWSRQTSDPTRSPHRTCIGCRRVAPAGELVRCATIDPDLVVLSRTAPGRGAWLCPSTACFEAATKRRSFERAFRRSVSPRALGELRSTFEGCAGNVRELNAAEPRLMARVERGKADR
ncbi:MAG: YlxR family protein [Acidimicrobiia bacterium]